MQIAYRDESGIPRSRTLDPLPSHEAEAYMKKSGKLGEHQQIAFAYVRQYPGSTSTELQDRFDKSATSSNVKFHKRLVEVERAGLIRRGEARKSFGTGCRAATWNVVEQKP